MPGNLDNRVDDIIRQLIIDRGLGTTPTDDGNWPVFASAMPDAPNNAICVYQTASRMNGRTNTDGEVQQLYGVQVRVRSETKALGDAKARDIAIDLDAVLRLSVTISTNTYRVHSVNRTSDVFPLGNEQPEGRRRIFTFNALSALRQTT